MQYTVWLPASVASWFPVTKRGATVTCCGTCTALPPYRPFAALRACLPFTYETTHHLHCRRRPVRPPAPAAARPANAVQGPDRRAGQDRREPERERPGRLA